MAVAKDAYKDPDKLRELYHEERLSMAEIGNRHGVSHMTVKYWMRKHGIERRSIFEAAKVRKVSTIPRFRTGLTGYEYASVGGTEYPIHRLIAVAENGIEAVKERVVHHKNGIKWDNRPDNLEVVTPSEHNQHHSLKYDLTELGGTGKEESEKDPVEVCFYCQDSVSDGVESPEGKPCHADCFQEEQERLSEISGGEWL